MPATTSKRRNHDLVLTGHGKETPSVGLGQECYFCRRTEGSDSAVILDGEAQPKRLVLDKVDFQHKSSSYHAYACDECLLIISAIGSPRHFRTKVTPSVKRTKPTG